MAPGAILATNVIAAEMGAMIALAIALAAAVVRARDRAESRAAAVAAENEALRDEVWRLREAVAGRERTVEARRSPLLADEARGGGAGAPAASSRGATCVLIVAGSPLEAPAIAARLEGFGAQVARAEGLAAGLVALGAGPRPDLVIVDHALGAAAADALSGAVDVPGARKSLILSSSFEPRAFGRNAPEDIDGCMIAMPAPALSGRLAVEFRGEPDTEVQLPSVVERPGETSDRDAGLPRAS
jgi:hypothetical protein